MKTDLLEHQENLDLAVRGCLQGGMLPGEVMDWVLDTLCKVAGEEDDA